MRVSKLLVVCLGLFSIIHADIGNLSVQPVGISPRALAMGNNFVALASDFSATYHNPAGLAILPVRLVQIGMGSLGTAVDVQSQSSNTEVQGVLIQKQRLALNNLGFLWSLPTTQGGFTIGFGFQSPLVFDNAFRYERRLSSDISEMNRFSSYGSLNLWSGSFGVQVAPGLSVGGTASFIQGRSNVSVTRRLFNSSGIIDTAVIGSEAQYSLDQAINRVYWGLDVRAGVLYSFLDMVSLGLRLDIPRTIFFSGDVDTRYTDHATLYTDEEKGVMQFPITGAAGVSLRLASVVLSAEARGRSPSPEDTTEGDGQRWRGGAGIGIEWTAAKTGLVLRGGTSYDQYDQRPYVLTYTEGLSGEGISTDKVVDKNMWTFSGGLAYLIGSSIAIEGAYAYSTWAMHSFTVKQEHDFHQILVSLSYKY